MLRSLRFEGAASRSRLAERTGLSKTTVSAIVTELLEVAAVEEEASSRAGRGRPAVPVRLRSQPHVSVGLEVNVDYVSAVVLDLAGRTRLSETRSRRSRDPDPLVALVDLAQAVHAQVEAAGAAAVGVTVAVPGLIAADRREVVWTPNLGIEHGTRLHDQVAAVVASRCPVEIANDANCAALAESRHGAAAGLDDAVYLTGTVGIGAGILERGVLRTGAHGFAGEVGHMPLGDPRAVCGCGRTGCWEASIGLHALLRATRMPELEDPLTTAAAVAVRARTDPAVAGALRGLGELVGLGLSALTAVLDPRVVVLGGYFVPLGDHVLEPARLALARRSAPAQRPVPDLRLGALGIRAAATGAAERGLMAVLSGEAALDAPAPPGGPPPGAGS
ncbi:sugar kinase [Nocardioides sp. OK12]|uniref:ROK family transcriptional regulator n=1 Tax=Nocardioides sp. OK12 TaxID=2758661 RepID=UPI0021C41CA0|nr:ROK family transcriptional regulator [Nocardioides sp. OK12]GHJ58519.1 sugar kinase [Nocardioides sp. OK12]